MIKCVALIRRRAGLSHREFVEYYENHHAPLARKYLAPALHYQRRYLEPDTLGHQSDAGALTATESYDCLTELWFEDRATMNATLACLGEPEVAKIIIADEARFIDRDSIRFFVIEEEATTT